MSSKQFHSSKLNELNSLKKSNVSFNENPSQIHENQFNEPPVLNENNNTQSKPPSRSRSQAPLYQKRDSDDFKEVKTYVNPDGSQVRVTQEMKNVEGDPFKVHLNNLIGKNQEYFDHLGGKCVCGMCICGRCKCPKKNLTTDYLRGNNSEYQTNYIPHKCLDNLPTLKGDFFTSQYNKTPLDYSTTHRVDYRPPGSSNGLNQRKNMKPEKNYAPFLGSSSYRSDYVNWGANPSSNLKPGYQATVIKELPFVGRTIYRDNYQGVPGNKDDEMAKLISNSRYGMFRSPVSPDFPFMGETTHNNTYKPFKTYKFGDNNKGRKTFEQFPSYGGQFLSTNGKDFDNKGIRKCPAREVLNRLYQQGVISWGR